ncbi:hypothetical protein RB195_010387 [Necator americanus]|uniref:Zinc finger PHD-type domain-containing protein n=1 Tax=Necator americanus TaxID=51031 RepID=A0ABR1CXQ2_NECAM
MYMIMRTIGYSEGTPLQQEAGSSVIGRETESEQYVLYSSDGDEEMMEVVVEDDVENQELMREPTEGTQMELEQALQQMKETSKRLGLLTANIGRNGNTARRPDVPSVGRPQALTPLRRLDKRSHLHKKEQAKRKPTANMSDYARDERDACAVCLRKQPNNSTSNQICWIQCPTCEDWMHIDCISKVFPRDGSKLDEVIDSMYNNRTCVFI